MKKLAALLLMAVAMASTAQASLEVRSTIADSEGYYTMSIVDAETGEVVDQKRFQYQLDDTGVDYIIVGVDEAPTEEVKDSVGSSNSDSSVPDVSDASTTIDGSDTNSPSLPATEEVGAWDAVKDTLDSIRKGLQESLHHLENVLEKRKTTKGSSDLIQSEETLVVPDEVFEFKEEIEDTTTEGVEAPKE